jgi:hypothetical protein
VTRGLSIASLGFTLLLLAASARSNAEETTDSFEYLYVRAHEGNASGGHAAIRFGESTFDFQHDAGWLVPRREDSRHFQHMYRTLENRSIEVSRVAATPAMVALLRDTFERRLLAQSRQLEVLDEVHRDVALLEALGAAGDVRVSVRGAGFFAPSTARIGDTPPALIALRRRIVERYGGDWLAQRRAAAQRGLREASLAPADVGALVVDPLVYPVVGPSLSRRIGEALAALAALDAIEQPQPLAAGMRTGETLGADASLALDAASQDRLRGARARLEDTAVALIASQRPDWGEAFLLAAARLVTIDESLATGRLVTLDALPPDARALPVSKRRRALAPALLAEAREDLAAARDRFFASSGFPELEFRALEESANRVAELRAVADGASVLRVASGPLLPEGRATIAVEVRPATPPGDLARALAAARDAERSLRRALEAEYRYDLVTRNCVSELFRTVEAALVAEEGAPAAADREAVQGFVARESERRLGGYVDPEARANFIPFVSSRNVRGRWEVIERVHLPSARLHAVAREGTLHAALRESNVFTATLYTPVDRSGFFVFFTDGSWPLRPLLGAINLGAALARSGVGILQLPFDRGRGLREGLDGALWSLPELFFANIRKGTNEYVPPALRPPPG